MKMPPYIMGPRLPFVVSLHPEDGVENVSPK
jgi:hypothetical protein